MEDQTGGAQKRVTRPNKTRWAIGILVTIVVGVLVYREATALPEYDGKPIRYFLKDLKLSLRSPAYDVAVEAVKAVGPEALDYYLSEATDPIPGHVEFFVENRDKLPAWMASRLHRWIDPYAYRNRKAGAVDAIYIIKDQIQDTAFTNRLVTFLSVVPPGEMHQIAEILNAMNVNTVDLVLPNLEKTNSPRLFASLDVVIEFGSASNSNAIPALSSLLNKGTAAHTYKALYALRTIGEPAMPILHRAFHSEFPQVREAALNLLGQHPDFLPDVVLLLKDTDRSLRLKACWQVVQMMGSGAVDESELDGFRGDMMRMIKHSRLARGRHRASLALRERD